MIYLLFIFSWASRSINSDYVQDKIDIHSSSLNDSFYVDTLQFKYVYNNSLILKYNPTNPSWGDVVYIKDGYLQIGSIIHAFTKLCVWDTLFCKSSLVVGDTAGSYHFSVSKMGQIGGSSYLCDTMYFNAETRKARYLAGVDTSWIVVVSCASETPIAVGGYTKTDSVVVTTALVYTGRVNYILMKKKY